MNWNTIVNWNLRYARGMDEEAVNRLIPTTSQQIDYPVDSWSSQLHNLVRPVGNTIGIITHINSYGYGKHIKKPATVSIFGGSQDWQDHANEAIDKHLEEEPVDLPNKRDPHHPDNHLHVLHRVKSWIATQV